MIKFTFYKKQRKIVIVDFGFTILNRPCNSILPERKYCKSKSNK